MGYGVGKAQVHASFCVKASGPGHRYRWGCSLGDPGTHRWDHSTASMGPPGQELQAQTVPTECLSMRGGDIAREKAEGEPPLTSRSPWGGAALLSVTEARVTVWPAFFSSQS